ncbi:unnamed protein product, partial [Scytosiphon promiscuus]
QRLSPQAVSSLETVWEPDIEWPLMQTPLLAWDLTTLLVAGVSMARSWSSRAGVARAACLARLCQSLLQPELKERAGEAGYAVLGRFGCGDGWAKAVGDRRCGWREGHSSTADATGGSASERRFAYSESPPIYPVSLLPPPSTTELVSTCYASWVPFLRCSALVLTASCSNNNVDDEGNDSASAANKKPRRDDWRQRLIAAYGSSARLSTSAASSVSNSSDVGCDGDGGRAGSECVLAVEELCSALGVPSVREVVSSGAAMAMVRAWGLQFRNTDNGNDRDTPSLAQTLSPTSVEECLRRAPPRGVLAADLGSNGYGGAGEEFGDGGWGEDGIGDVGDGGNVNGSGAAAGGDGGGDAASDDSDDDGGDADALEDAEDAGIDEVRGAAPGRRCCRVRALCALRCGAEPLADFVFTRHGKPNMASGKPFAVDDFPAVTLRRDVDRSGVPKSESRSEKSAVSISGAASAAAGATLGGIYLVPCSCALCVADIDAPFAEGIRRKVLCFLRSWRCEQRCVLSATARDSAALLGALACPTFSEFCFFASWFVSSPFSVKLAGDSCAASRPCASASYVMSALAAAAKPLLLFCSFSSTRFARFPLLPLDVPHGGSTFLLWQVVVPHIGSLTGGHTTPDLTGKPLKGVLFDLSHLGVSCQDNLDLVDLPESYTELYGLAKSPHASAAAAVGAAAGLETDPAVCLVLAAGSKMSTMGHVGECTLHARECGSGVGVFFLVQRCVVLLIRDSRGAYYQSIYLDDHGEEDAQLKRGRPLFLNKHRYDSLKQLYLRHRVAQEVSAIRASSDRVIRENYY